MKSCEKYRDLTRFCRKLCTIQKAGYKSAVCTEIGKPLQIVDDGQTLNPASLGKSEVAVTVKACGINFADILVCKGLYQVALKPPFVPGFELAGEVAAVGDNVTKVKKNDRVASITDTGGFSQYCVVKDENLLRKIPDSVSFEAAASALASYGTSMLALTRHAKLQEGETLFVTGAAGSTGLAAVELGAKVLKAKVIGSCGSPEKADLIRSRGACDVIDYTTEDVRQRLKELTSGKGPNVVYDTVGGDLFLNCLKSLAHEGRILTIGYTSGKIPNIPANLLLMKSISAMGAFWGDYRIKNYPVFAESLDTIINLLSSGAISPHIGAVLPLSEINTAFERILKRQTVGKTVIAP